MRRTDFSGDDQLDFGDDGDDLDCSYFEQAASSLADHVEDRNEDFYDHAYSDPLDETNPTKAEEQRKFLAIRRRKRAIFNWLCNSDVTFSRPGLNGFYVEEGTLVQLKGVETVDITLWLRDECFFDNSKIEDFTIRYRMTSEPKLLRIYFEKPPVVAPFERSDIDRSPTKEGYLRNVDQYGFE